CDIEKLREARAGALSRRRRGRLGSGQGRIQRMGFAFAPRRKPRHPVIVRAQALRQMTSRETGRKERVRVRTQADIDTLEQVPVAERIRQKNVLELLGDAAAAHGDGLAIRYLSGTTPADPVRDVTFNEVLRH